MAAVALRSEERIGLGVAIAAHAALVVLLLWRPHASPVITPPDRIEVTISDDVGLQSTSPQPQSEAAPDIAPELGEPAPPELAPPEPALPSPAPRAEPQPAPPPPPVAKPEPPRPAPRPVAKPVVRPQPPRPVARPTARPQPPKPVSPPATRTVSRPSPAPAARPAPRPSAAPAAKPNPRASAAARPSVAEAFKSVTRPGGSRIGADFLKGTPGARANTPAAAPAAAAIGPQVKASIGQAVARQLKPHWVAPQGADAEQLVTLVRFRLARDGSLVGDPQVVSQSGETPANAAQKARHAEQAIRAVRLAAPFDLPEEYYSAWQTVTSRFDRRLSQ